MQCRSVLTRLDAMRTGELTGDDSSEIHRHVGYCASCNESIDDVAQFAEIIRSLPISAPTGNVASALLDSFDSFEFDRQQVWVAFSTRGVCRIDLRSADESEFRNAYDKQFGRELRRAALPSEYREAIEAALRGESPKIPAVDLSGLTPFEAQVLETILRIPCGEVRTYEWVARAVDRPKAIRAVGNVMATNPIPFLLPCHRVVPTSGGIGNYGYGTSMKKQLLAAEGAPVEELEELARKRVRFIGSKTTKIFCFPTCRDARRIQEKNRIAFHDTKEAGKHGYRPCKRCTPAVAA